MGGQYPDLYEKGTALLLLPEDIGGGTVWSVSNSQNSVQGFNGCTGQFISQFSGNGSNTLNAPDGMAIAPNGNFYVMNYANSHVEIFDANGSYISQFGSMGTGNGQFTNTGGGIAINAINENVYVSDGGDSRVEIFDANGSYISQFGSYGSGNGQFNGPAGIAIDTSGTVYVADYYNSRVEYFNANGTYISQFGVSGNGYSSGTLIDPRGLAIDTNSNIYVVSSYGGNRVDEFSLIGTWLSRFGSQGTGNGQFESPNGIAIGPGGKIYVADAGNNRVQVFDANENYLFQFSQPNPTFLFVR